MALLPNNTPIPINDPIARVPREQFRPPGRRDPLEGMLTDTWQIYFDQQSQVLQNAPARVATVEVEQQSASIGATDISGGVLNAGLYQVQYYARITLPNGISSSLTVTIDWTDGGVAQSFSGAAMTGNTTTTWQDRTLFFRIDALSPIRYSTTYATGAGAPMEYRLDVALLSVRA